MNIKINNLDEMKEFAEELALRIDAPHLVLLNGELGAGKTQLVKFIAQALNGDKEVAHSPSYSLINTYELVEETIHHVDLYRLEDFEDLHSTGFWDLFGNQEHIIIVEWADKLDESDWPGDWPSMSLTIAKGKGQERLIT